MGEHLDVARAWPHELHAERQTAGTPGDRERGAWRPQEGPYAVEPGITRAGKAPGGLTGRRRGKQQIETVLEQNPIESAARRLGGSQGGAIGTVGDGLALVIQDLQLGRERRRVQVCQIPKIPRDFISEDDLMDLGQRRKRGREFDLARVGARVLQRLCDAGHRAAHGRLGRRPFGRDA